MNTKSQITPQVELLAFWNSLSYEEHESAFSAKYSTKAITGQFGKQSAYLIQSVSDEALDIYLRDYDSETVMNSFLNDSDVSGGFIKLRDNSVDHGSVLVCHDFETSAALAKLTGKQVYCSVYPENTRSVAQAVARKDSKSTVVAFENSDEVGASKDYQSIKMPRGTTLLEKIHSDSEQVLEKILEAEQTAQTVGKQNEVKKLDVAPAHATSISPEALVRRLLKVVKECVSIDDDSALIWVMYAFFTYLTRNFYHAALLFLTSPVRRCGKSTLLQMCAYLFFNITNVKGITKASLEMLLSAKGTPLIDEFDEVLRNNPGVIGVLNGGIEAGSKVTLVSKDGTVKTRETFGAKVLSGIGGLPSTLNDRSILVRMRRKLHTEHLVKPHDRKETLAFLKREIQQWCDANAAAVSSTKVEPLEVNNDRFRDNYEPLLKIAACISKELEILVRDAAVRMVNSQYEENIGGERLLADIKLVLDTSKKKEVGTNELLALLCEHEDSVWRRYKANSSITAVDLARELSLFNIRPVRIRNVTQMRGYKREQFQEAFMRYVTEADQADISD
jgi:hypothetical protein